MGVSRRSICALGFPSEKLAGLEGEISPPVVNNPPKQLDLGGGTEHHVSNNSTKSQQEVGVKTIESEW